MFLLCPCLAKAKWRQGAALANAPRQPHGNLHGAPTEHHAVAAVVAAATAAVATAAAAATAQCCTYAVSDNTHHRGTAAAAATTAADARFFRRFHNAEAALHTQSSHKQACTRR